MESTTPLLNNAQALVAAIQKGDKQAESDLVKTYWRGVKFIILKQCGELHLAEDIAQEALIVLIQKIRKQEISEPDTLSSFVRQTAVNMLIAHRRKELRRKTDTNEEVVICEADKSKSLCDFVDAGQMRQKVEELILELPTQRDRELLRRYFMLEQEKPQICHDLMLSADQFDKVLYRAKDRLKRKILSCVDGHDYQQHIHKLAVFIFCLIYSTSYDPPNPTPRYVPEKIFAIKLRECERTQHLVIDRRLVTFMSQQSNWLSSLGRFG